MEAQLRALNLLTLGAELERAPGGVALWLELRRPHSFNAVSMEMLAELHAVVDLLRPPRTMLEAPPADWPRVVIIRAAGRAFSGGVDVKAADRGVGGATWDYKAMRSQQLLAALITALRAIPQPVIAAVQGPAAGAGLALALAADVRVATRAASFSAAFVRLGLTGADMGCSFHLPRVAGLGIAAEAMLAGRALSAERAFQVGLVNELVETGEALAAAARSFAAEMLALSPLGLSLGKEALNAAADGGSLRATLTAENSHQMLLINAPASAAIAQRWLDSMMGGKKGGAAAAGRSKM
jgi:enoyl-CoA hydratase